MLAPSRLNATDSALEDGSVAGFAYLVPKPELLHGYAVTRGDVL